MILYAVYYNDADIIARSSHIFSLCYHSSHSHQESVSISVHVCSLSSWPQQTNEQSARQKARNSLWLDKVSQPWSCHIHVHEPYLSPSLLSRGEVVVFKSRWNATRDTYCTNLELFNQVEIKLLLPLKLHYCWNN